MPSQKCGARTRSGSVCGQPAMFNGRCRLHGGKSLAGPASPNYKHGRYSKVLPAGLLERYEESLNDPDQLNLANELALVDSRLSELAGTLGTREAGRAWKHLAGAHRDLKAAVMTGDRGKVDAATDRLAVLIEAGGADAPVWEQLGPLIDRRRGLVESEMKRIQTAGSHLHVESVHVFVSALLSILQKHIPDRNKLNAIVADVREIIRGNATPKLTN